MTSCRRTGFVLIRAAIPKILENPDFKKWYTASDMIPAFMTHDQYQAMIDQFAKEQHDAFVKNGLIAQ